MFKSRSAPIDRFWLAEPEDRRNTSTPGRNCRKHSAPASPVRFAPLGRSCTRAGPGAAYRCHVHTGKPDQDIKCRVAGRLTVCHRPDTRRHSNSSPLGPGFALSTVTGAPCTALDGSTLTMQLSESGPSASGATRFAAPIRSEHFVEISHTYLRTGREQGCQGRGRHPGGRGSRRRRANAGRWAGRRSITACESGLTRRSRARIPMQYFRGA